MNKPVLVVAHPRIGSPVVSTATHDGARLQYARWNVSWSNGRPDPSPERIATILSPWCGDVAPSSAPACATLMNAAALRLAIRLHRQSAPELEEFVAAAPHGSDTVGFGFCFVDPVIASLAAEWAVRTVHEATHQGATMPFRAIDELVGEAHAAFGHLWPSKDSARVLLEAARRGIPITRLTDHAPVHRLGNVPVSGERVRTSAVANASAGGTRVDVTDRVHPDTMRLAESIAAAFDVDLAGIDLITPDITRSWREASGAINEVNVNPGLLDSAPAGVG